MITDMPVRKDRRRTLMITAFAMVVVYIMWNIPFLQPILYPLELFTTYVHESGHALATILTGGRVQGFLVSMDTSGLTSRYSGADWLVIPAGYLGAALFGSGLFLLVNRLPRFVNWVAVILGIGMTLLSLFFAAPDESGLPLALFLGVGFGMILVMLGLRANPLWVSLVLNVLAVSTALQAFFDLRYLMFAISASRGEVGNDAVQFSQRVTPLIPASWIALSWAAIALLMFATALYYGAWKPLHQEINETYDSMRNR